MDVVARHLEVVGGDAGAHVVQLALDAGDDDAAAVARPALQVAIEVGEDELRDRGRQMLLGDGDPVVLPEPPDLVLRRLHDLELKLGGRQSLRETVVDDVERRAPVAGELGGDVAGGERGGEVGGDGDHERRDLDAV